MDNYFVNVIVSEPDMDGNSDEMFSVCYKFIDWKSASEFIKLSLDNGLIAEVRIPDDARDNK